MVNSVTQDLGRNEIDALSRIRYAKLYMQLYVIKKITEFESKGMSVSREEFKTQILAEIRENLLKNPVEYIRTHDLGEYDHLRFKLNSNPGVFMKYGFVSSCGNVAAAFAHEFGKISNDEIMFLHSTKWDHLEDGMSGHTVPCVRMEDNQWIMVEPQINPKTGVFTRLIRDQDFQPGKTIEHLLPSMVGQPYVITERSDKNYSDYKQFMAQAGRVPHDQAQKFINNLADIMIAKGAHSSVYISPKSQVSLSKRAIQKTMEIIWRDKRRGMK